MTLGKVVQRLTKLVLVALIVSFITLFILDLAPGDPVLNALGPEATPEMIKETERALNLDGSIWHRYTEWLGDVIHGDLGRGTLNRQEVWLSIKQRLPVTLEITILSMLVALSIAIPVGAYAGSRPGGWLDRAALVYSSSLYSVPGFLLAVILLYFLSLRAGVLPTQGWVPLTENAWENLRHALMPTLSLALPISGGYIRLLRNDMASTLQEDYIAAARATGLPNRRVLFRHALRPSMLTLVTVMGVTFGTLLGGTVLVESIFSLPGVGTLGINAVLSHDYGTMRGIVLFFSIIYVGINTVVDSVYPLLDPRVRG